MRSHWNALLLDWQATLRAEHKSPETITAYALAVRQLVDHLESRERLGMVGDVEGRDVSAFITSVLAVRSPATANQRYRSLQQWFRWLTDVEEEIDTSPMAKLRPPKVPEAPPDVLTVDQVRALLADAKGNDMISRRDSAIIRLLFDLGGRLGELARLRVDDVDRDRAEVHVVGKGRRPRTLAMSSNTALAMGRYLRSRAAEKCAARPELWLADRNRGPLARGGIHQMLQRRGQAAGIDGLHAHLFRHTAAHRWLAAGGSESDLMKNMGWRSPQMLRRYGASLAEERAREASRRLGLGDEV